VPYANNRALIALCSRVGGTETFRRIGPSDPKLQKQVVEFALASGQTNVGGEAALALAQAGSTGDRTLLLDYCDRLLGVGDAASAGKLWNAMLRHGLLPQLSGPAADLQLLNNASFRSRPEGRGFDWRVYSDEGAFVSAGSGLQVSLTGRQRDGCVLAEQHVIVSPGDQLLLKVDTQDLGVAGLNWVAYPLRDWNSPLASLPISETGTRDVEVPVPGGVDVIRVVLRYNRARGTVRSEGEARFRLVELRRLG
jgi:hypothetical protein